MMPLHAQQNIDKKPWQEGVFKEYCFGKKMDFFQDHEVDTKKVSVKWGNDYLPTIMENMIRQSLSKIQYDQIFQRPN